RTRCATCPPLPLDHGEALTQPLDTAPDEAAVNLDLGLARTAAEPHAAALAFQVGPATREPGQQVLELGHLHLNTPLCRGGAPREDGEDHLGAIQDRDIPHLLQVALLARGQGAIAEHGGIPELSNTCGEHVD